MSLVLFWYFFLCYFDSPLQNAKAAEVAVTLCNVMSAGLETAQSSGVAGMSTAARHRHGRPTWALCLQPPPAALLLLTSARVYCTWMKAEMAMGNSATAMGEWSFSNSVVTMVPSNDVIYPGNHG